MEFANKSSIDALLCFGSSRDVQRNDVAVLEESVLRVNCLNASSLNSLLRAESVVCINFHLEALSDASHVSTYVAESENTELLALQLATRLAVVEVAHAVNEQTEHELCHSIRVLTRCVLNNNVLLLSVSTVDIVVTGTGTYNDFKLLCSVKHLWCNLV